MSPWAFLVVDSVVDLVVNFVVDLLSRGLEEQVRVAVGGFTCVQIDQRGNLSRSLCCSCSD